MESAPCGVWRAVPEITICATLVAAGSFTAQEPMRGAKGVIGLSPVQPWQLTQAPWKILLPSASDAPPPSLCGAGAARAVVAGRSDAAPAGTLRGRAPTP